ncbi:hypothetical protein P389DRAFT_170473 [Cystobasidium minutum MCA 4210]|uniref:uncharacterized protein n=1 Tax=Cystobasidium minutum MCA 4210 TaxID=1397322 RepID=UPI0034CEB956|eukprot:jgi/Rhomi1/170473/fgenesh1_kg.4_\
MKFLNILSIAAAGLAVCSFLPTVQGAAIEKRDAASDCKVILDNAKGKITPLKSQLLEAYGNGDLNNEAYVKNNILPIVVQISNVVSIAAKDITLVQLNINHKEKRQVDEEAVAHALAALVHEIVEALEPLLHFLGHISIVSTLLGTLLARLDADLKTIAVGLGLLLGGVLTVVRDLLESLTNALSGLGFLNFLRVIGLLS